MSLEQDVSALILFAHDKNQKGNEKPISEVIAQVIKSHGADNVLSNLLERNQTGIIKSLVSVLEDFIVRSLK